MIVARHTNAARRRGAILLVVLALLALFAVIGLSFVLYAESEATSSRIYREAKDNRDRQPPPSEQAFGLALSQMVYGPSLGGTPSAFAGHDFARLMYGFDPTAVNDVPYNGLGLLHEQLTLPTGVATPPTLTIDRAEVVNFHPFRLSPTGPFVQIDPELSFANGSVRTFGAATTGMVFVGKNGPYTYPDRNNLLLAGLDPTTGRVFVPSNHRPSLFGPLDPTNRNWYSALGRLRTLRVRPIDQVRTADLPAMIAELSGIGVSWPIQDVAVTPANVAQVNAVVAKYTQFPYPVLNPDGTLTGDVENLRFSAGVQSNDSVWVDPGLETYTYKGRKIAPLVAVLAVPLDGRLNLNVAGNLKNGGSHAGNQGFGPHEANLAAVLRSPANAAGLVAGRSGSVTGGTAALAASYPPGYGPIEPGTTVTNPTELALRTSYGNSATGLTSKPLPVTPPGYSLVDWGGTATVSNWLSVPQTGVGNGELASGPTYNIQGSNTAAVNHPALSNPFLRPLYRTADANEAPLPMAAGQPPAMPHAFPLTDLRLFAAKYSGKTVDYRSQTYLANDFRTTDSRRTGIASRPEFQREFLGDGTTFLPSQGAGPGSPGNVTRALVTPFSSSLVVPGLSPNYLTAAGQTLAIVPPGAGNPNPPAYPQLYAPNGGATPTTVQSPVFQLTAAAGDGTGDNKNSNTAIRNLRAALGGVNLNRPLADYRGPNTTTSLAQVFDSTITPNLIPPGGGAPQPAATVVPLLESAAWNDRQQLAADVFIRLCVATGARIAFDTNIPADDPASPTPVNIPAGAKLPYSDNVTRQQTNNSVTRFFRSGYVLPQPTGYDATNNVTTYTLFLNPAQQNDGSLAGGTQVPVSKAEYDALRWLAQLAANVVDQVDGDDVSTAFVWNPAPRVTTPGDATNQPVVAAFPAAGDTTSQVPPSLVPSTATSRTQAADAAINPAGWPTSLNPARAASPSFVFVDERAVFGVEKPRLVLNEAYAEVANDPADKAAAAPAWADKDFRVRFWFELLNPSSEEAADTLLAGPDGLGAVPLSLTIAGTPQAVYRLEVFDKGTAVLNQLSKSGNVTGRVDEADPVFPIPAYNLTDATTSRINSTNRRLQANLLTGVTSTAGPVGYVEANGGQPTYLGGSRFGFAVVGPNVATTDQYTGAPKAFIPDTAAAPYNLMLQKPVRTAGDATTTDTDQDHLDYYVKLAGNGAIQTEVLDRVNADPNRHTALLQRLANPYLPFDPVTNPYVTVDVMSQIGVENAIRFADDAPSTTTPATPSANRASIGRVQPFAGYQNRVSGTAPDDKPTYEYPLASQNYPTLTLKQTGTDGTSGGSANDEKLTFFRHNYQTAPPTGPTLPAVPGGETVLAPFQWLVQFDRKLVNATELGQVTAVPAHQLTRQFALPVLSATQQEGTGLAVAFHRHTLAAQAVTDGTGTPVVYPVPAAGQAGPLAAADSPLFRALDVLQTKPWTHAVPLGGRMPGRVNINYIWDELSAAAGGAGRSQVFDAILDRAAGNTFTDEDRTAIWQALKATRSPAWATSGQAPGTTYGPVVGVTADEAPIGATGAFDRPIKGFGTAQFGAVTAAGGLFRPAGGGLADTLLRTRNQAAVPAAGTNPGVAAGDNQALFDLVRAPATPRTDATTAAHPYMVSEPLRKVLNSFTSTSDSFVLVATVGWFEVREEIQIAGSPPQRVLGAEVYDQAPGDLRGQYMAVIDRTGLAVDHPVLSPQTQSSQVPWTVELASAVPAGSTGVAAELVGPGAPRGSWNGTPSVAAPPQSAELQFHDGQTSPAYTPSPLLQDPPNSNSGYWQIIPRYTRDSGGNIDTAPTGTQTMEVSATYEGQPLVLSSVVRNDGTLVSTTPFWVGTGERRELVEAFYDGTNRWSINPTTGQVRVNIRPVGGTNAYPASRAVAGGFAFDHGGGTVASKVVFRHPGPQNKIYTPGQTDPVVRMVAELK